MPLRTGPVAVANLGVVVTFRLPLVVVACAAVLDGVAEEELLEEELPEEAQPVSSANAAPMAGIARRLPIWPSTLA